MCKHRHCELGQRQCTYLLSPHVLITYPFIHIHTHPTQTSTDTEKRQ